MSLVKVAISPSSQRGAKHNQRHLRLLPRLRVAFMLFMPVAIVAAFVGVAQPTALRASASTHLSTLAQLNAPAISPPSNIGIVPLDSSLHVTWTPSSDPATAWHVVSVWDGAVMQQSKVVGKTSKAAQTNGLVPGHTYTVKVQAMDAAGNLSDPVSMVSTTDPQSPMPNAAFFENFNGPAGDLDGNYFDVRTLPGSGSQPESIGDERMLVFNNENHFHTQIIGGRQRQEIYIRPRVPFDFANRTGTFQLEVDSPAVQSITGKWFEIHLVRNVPGSARVFGAGNGEQLADSLEFSIRQGDATDENHVNIPQITANIGGVVTTFEGNLRQMSPTNIRMPIVLKVSQTSAEFFVNGVSVVRATGFTLPFTQGYWMIAHRGLYAERAQALPVALQLLHWETIQFDGPAGSYNPVVKAYIQPGCSAVVRYGRGQSYGIRQCDELTFSGGRATVNLNIPDNLSTARSARLFFNAQEGPNFPIRINGHQMTVPYTDLDEGAYDYLEPLQSAEIPTSWLNPGTNQVIFLDNGNTPHVAQVEVEVVYNQARTMAQPVAHDMPMLSATNMSFYVHHVASDPNIYTATTYLYNLGGVSPLVYNASVISTEETPWLSVSPATGMLVSPSYGGGVTPITLRLDLTNVTTDGDGVVGVVKVTGGNMPTYIAILVVADGSPPQYQYIQNFTNVTTTFNKDAIPGYHGDGTPVPTNTQGPAGTSTPTLFPQVTRTSTPTRTPTKTPTPAGGTPQPTSTATPCVMTFSDVHTTDYFYDAVQYLWCHGAISGYSNGTFRPYNDITRGQLCKVIVLAEGWPINTTGGPHFSDVHTNNTFYTYIETAFNHGVITGYADGSFHPSSNITRAQLSKIIVLAQNWAIDTTGGPHFSDVPTTHAFYTYVETAFNRGIMSGYAGGVFMPEANSTRGQVSKIVYQAITQPPGNGPQLGWDR